MVNLFGARRYRWILVWAVSLISLVMIASEAHASPGELDPSFAGDGWLETTIFHHADGTGVAVQTDGNIVVSINSRWHSLFAVARFLPDGTLDPSFGNGGRVSTDFVSDGHAEDLLLQPDGRILVAGTTGRRMIVVRYLSDGTLDATFDGNGKAAVRFPHRTVHVAAASLTDQGEIVLAGTVTRRGGRRSKFAVVRLTSSGTLDSTFSGDGKVLVSTGKCGWCSYANDVDVAGDGGIVAVGSSGTYPERVTIVMLDDDGNLVTAFDQDGVRVTRFGMKRAMAATSVSWTPTGNVLVGGWMSSAHPNWGFPPIGFLAQFLPNGRLDPSFSGDGRTRIPEVFSSSIRLQPDDKVLVGGAQCCGGGSEQFFALSRLETNGSPDLSFGNKGLVVGNELAEGGWLGMALQPDGRIVVTGGAERDAIVLARYLN